MVDSILQAGNPVKEILLKLNLPDHRILKDGQEVKELQERCIIKAFKLSNQERYEHVGLKVTSSQDGKVYKMEKRDYAWLMNSRTSKLNAIAYKIGLESVEARLLVYKKNESVYEEDIKVLKCEIHLREVAITELRRKLSDIYKCKTGLGYNVVPPPYTGNFIPPKPDLSFSGLEEFTSEPIVIKPIVEISEAKASEAKPKAVRKNTDAPIIEDWVSDNEEDDVPQAKIEKKTFKPSFAKIEFVKPKQQEKTARKTVNHVKQNRQNIHTPRGNQRNWNNMMSQRLGSNFEMFNKACYVCGSFDHLQVDCKKVNQKQFQNTKPIWNNAQRVNHQNFAKKSHPCVKKNMVPRAVLMKSGLVSLNTARQVNTAHPKIIVNSARPMINLSKSAHSTVKWPIHKNTTFKNSNFNQMVNTVKDKNVNTVRPKAVVNVVRPKAIVNVVKGNNVNAVKASACWVWKPKTKVLDHDNPQIDLQDQGVIDSGCSRHMIGNMSYLTDYEETDGGYVAFEGNPKGGKITSRVHRKNNMYSVDLKNIVPKGGLTCLFAKATSDESELWHRRLGHINFKTINKLVKGNLVRGLPSKLFENNQTCVACQKGKKHRASCKSKTMYCLVVTDDYSRFSWVFFLATKDETSGILKSFITRVENLIDQRVKLELLNKRVAERKNKTLIEAARTMLADSKLPTTFWAEAVNTACYVQNRVLVTKPHNKTPYELFLGRKPALGFMRPFGCPVTILNTIDHLGKFDGKADEGFFVGYSINSKAFRVFNSRTRIVEENLHVQFSENTPNIAGSGPNWLFDIDALTKSMNYKPVVARNQSNGNAGTKACDDAGKARMETVLGKDYILLPLWTADPPFSQSSKSSQDDGSKPLSDDEKKVDEDPRKDSESIDQEKDDNVNSTNNVNVASTNEVNVVGGKTSIELPDDPNMPALEDYSIFDLLSDDQDNGAEADMNNLDTTIQVSPIPTTRIHKDHPVEQIIGDLNSAPQTRRMTKNLEEHGLFSSVQQRTNHKDFQNCLFACFLSQEEPKKVIHALKDPSWIEAMQEELRQFKLQEVWTLVYLPNGKRDIGTKWVFRNKKYEKGIVIKNKARLVAQGYTQEEGINYDEVFAHVARIEAIRLFLAYASFKYFVVYQMDVKSAFLYSKIEEEVYVCQLPGFEDPDFPDRVYKVEKALYGLHQAPRAWYETLSTYLLDNGFQRGKIDKTLFIRRDKRDILLVQVYKEDWIFINQDKYVTEILKKFGFTDVKTASTPIETQKLLLKDEDGEEVDVHLYRSMIGSLMYLTSSRPDIMFALCQPKLGLWYLKDSPFDLVAYTDSDYARASLDRKSTTGGCQFLGSRLISWQCKKQTVVANSTIEAEYVAASSCCGQVLWIQNQLLDYGKPKRRDTEVPQPSGPTNNVANDAIYKEMDDSLERAATNATSLDAEKDKGGGPRHKETMGDTIAQTRAENVSKLSNDLLLARGNTLRSGEDSMKLKELMELCTNFQNRVIDLEKTKTSQAQEITSLKRRVKRLEKKGGSRTPHRLKKIIQGLRVVFSELPLNSTRRGLPYILLPSVLIAIGGGTEGAVQQGPVRARVLNDLSAEEKERYKADIRATNILLQGIPKDIYSLINHYTDAKDIWENVKMILEGSELTKDDRESQMQLNSKFVNNMLPEWSRFITEVKLNRGLKESNSDQLYAYLKQHEVHANENKRLAEL
ncbi:putative ribonuclease H-like domain-containing protein [Tanacetum coccineum]|uniref:Ribonuclease H-like domain-containing protein n=1 Tax=Tanacetum coccineum TaxID=301880 RepID=A0ABQ5E0U5_9ASTR